MTRKKKKETSPMPAASGPRPVQRALSAAERKRLRGLAHPLRPLVQLGREGLSPGALAEVDRGLASHELVKVRLSGERQERAAQAEEIARSTGAGIAGTIGMVTILFRQNPDPDERRIELGVDLYG
jgi:RNA-binding protein